MKHAIVGSRAWPLEKRQDIALQLNRLFTEHGQFIVVSGGAEGVCDMAEKTAMEFPLPLVSFRVTAKAHGDLPTYYRVDEWRLYRGTGQLVEHEPTFADFMGAAGYKAMLIAERAESASVFWDGHSRGTEFEIECFKAAGVPFEVFS